MAPPPDRDDEVRRLRRNLRDARKDIRLLRAQLAAAPPVQEDPWEGMSAAEIRHLHAQFTPSPPGGPPCPECGKLHPGPCETCGGLHARKCRRVKEISYQMQGDRVILKHVINFRDGKWSEEGIIWPDELPPVPDEV